MSIKFSICLNDKKLSGRGGYSVIVYNRFIMLGRGVKIRRVKCYL